MTEKLKQTIEKEVAELPKELREAINASGWVNTAEEIGKANNLDEGDVEDFQLETLLVLIGVVDAQFYAINIENHVEVTKEKAESLAKEAWEKIFAPIRKTVEENVKKNLKDKNPDWKQSLDFIMSGGDYTAFLEDQRGNSEPR